MLSLNTHPGRQALVKFKMDIKQSSSTEIVPTLCLTVSVEEVVFRLDSCRGSIAVCQGNGKGQSTVGTNPTFKQLAVSINITVLFSTQGALCYHRKSSRAPVFDELRM